MFELCPRTVTQVQKALLQLTEVLFCCVTLFESYGLQISRLVQFSWLYSLTTQQISIFTGSRNLQGVTLAFTQSKLRHID